MMRVQLLLVTVLVAAVAPLTVPISERSKTAEFTNGSSGTSSLLRSILDASSGENAVHYLDHLDNPANYQVNNATTGGGLDEELSRVLDGFVFLNNLYDALVRPGQFDHPGPTAVEISVTVHPGVEVNEERNELTATLTLYQSWVDRRLAYKSRIKYPERLPSVTLAGSMEPWLPDTFVMNEKRTVHHDFIGGSDLIRIFPIGRVEREQRMTTTVHCPFYRNDRFPFDTHVCHINLTSFSWNRKQLEYKLGNGTTTGWNDLKGQAGPFGLHHCAQSVVTFPREELQLGESSGMIYSVVLKRNLSHYSSKVFAPLALFTLVAVVGLGTGVGPQLGAALSYFMFGAMSIFMALLLRDQSSWAYGRTALDSYFVYSLVTVLLCGLLNLLKQRVHAAEPSRTTESYEMHLHQETASTSRRNGSARNGNVRAQQQQQTHWTTSTTRESDQMLDDEFSEEGRQGKFARSVRLRVREGLRSVSQLCSRINDFSAWFMLSVFISWNVLYWICYVAE